MTTAPLDWLRQPPVGHRDVVEKPMVDDADSRSAVVLIGTVIALPDRR
jgi:hypothetical protein